MQVKGWKIPSRSGPSDSEDGENEAKSAVEIAKERLIALEAAIERRYLKPPLGFSTAEGGIGIQPDQDESIPKGLGVWREAVLKSHTAAQLSMALYMLESCIAWDKSIMKAVGFSTNLLPFSMKWPTDLIAFPELPVLSEWRQ